MFSSIKQPRAKTRTRANLILKSALILLSALSYSLSSQAESISTEAAKSGQQTNTKVVISTNLGDITLELFDNKAPKTVANFVRYANEGFYKGTIFHRVIPNFMIQGGGFTEAMQRKSTHAPIVNEAQAFVPNVRGSIAMARTNNPHSATSQFFINTVNNRNLNKNSYNAGYAVFGNVTAGMNVVDAISASNTGVNKGMRDVPIKAVTINSVKVLETTSN